MKVVAIRGVCIGPDRHLRPGDVADVDESTSAFLIGIGAVQEAAEPPPAPPEPIADQAPAPKDAAKASKKGI